MAIKKKDAMTILTALSAGIVPSRGLQHILVGRANEASQILKDLEDVKSGCSSVKFFIGPFGSGKTFIQALTSQIAFKEDFVVSKVDFTPERRLYGRDGKARSTYSEIARNISIKTAPEGNALTTIIDKWISEIQSRVSIEKGYGVVAFDNEEFLKDVEFEIARTVSAMDDLVGGYDFARVLTLYFKAFVQNDEKIKRCAIKWLRGEYSTRTEAKNELGVRDIITDINYYEYIKVLSQFIKQIGYSGFVINFDEAINLYKITHSQTREKNYETILKMFNDTIQGNLEGIYLTIGGTPEFLEDERRGLFSYEALRSRLQGNKFETEEYRDLAQPVMKLNPLSHNENFVLLQKLREIHSIYNKYNSDITDEELKEFLKKLYSRPGAMKNITTRDIVRSFIDALNILYQNEFYDRTKIFGETNVDASNSIEDKLASRFVSRKG